MRRYFFNLSYVAGIRSGIQGGHAVEEMWYEAVNQYLQYLAAPEDRYRRQTLDDLMAFVHSHKTWVMLYGGDHEALVELFEFLRQGPYPVAKFHESGMNNVLTSITILIPETLYDDTSSAVGRECMKDRTAAECFLRTGVTIKGTRGTDQKDVRYYTEWELEFLRRKASCHLAN